jgi:hypothetical protein
MPLRTTSSITVSNVIMTVRSQSYGESRPAWLAGLITAIFLIYFVVCLPGLHPEGSAHGSAAAVQPGATAAFSPAHGEAGTAAIASTTSTHAAFAHSDPSGHPPHAEDGACEGSAALRPIDSRIGPASPGTVPVGLPSLLPGALATVHVCSPPDAARRSRCSSGPYGVAVLTMLCQARL